MRKSIVRVGVVVAVCSAAAGAVLAGGTAADGAWVAAPATSANELARPVAEDDEILVQLAAQMGEPRHYCLDIPGYPSSGDIDNHREAAWPLEAHTCKTGLPESGVITMDQRISRSALTADPGRILYTRLDACLELASIGTQAEVREDASAVVEDCTGDAAQQVTMTRSGKIKPTLDPSKCLTIGKEAFEAGNRAPGEPWYRRALTFSTCTETDARRQTWKIAAAPVSS